MERRYELSIGDKALDSAGLRARARIEAEVLRAARRYYEKEGFTEVVVPRIARATGSCENMDTLFGLDYFGQQAYLTQTGQLFLEVMVSTLGKVWCCGPSFRAESRVDNRHLTEFTLLEMEFCGSFEELLSRIENLVTEMVRGVVQNSSGELQALGVDVRRLEEIEPPFEKISYGEAQRSLGIEWGEDLSDSDERILVENYGGHPLFITHFPEHIKFFNMRRNHENPKVVNSADLILPISGESVGAAEREYEYEKVYEKLVTSGMFEQLEQKGGSLDEFEWYLAHLRKGGGVQHAGCGLGVDRILQFILGLSDIRQSTLFALNRETLF